jgi:hypothetical protein
MLPAAPDAPQGLGYERKGAVLATGRVYFPIAWLPPAAPGLVAAWQLLPCSGTVFGFGHFVMKSRDTTNSEATGSEPGKRGDLCRTERSRLLSRKRAFRARVTSASLAEGAWAVGPETAHLPSWTPGSPPKRPLEHFAAISFFNFYK